MFNSFSHLTSFIKIRFPFNTQTTVTRVLSFKELLSAFSLLFLNNFHFLNQIYDPAELIHTPPFRKQSQRSSRSVAPYGGFGSQISKESDTGSLRQSL